MTHNSSLSTERMRQTLRTRWSSATHVTPTRRIHSMEILPPCAKRGSRGQKRPREQFEIVPPDIIGLQSLLQPRLIPNGVHCHVVDHCFQRLGSPAVSSERVSGRLGAVAKVLGQGFR